MRALTRLLGALLAFVVGSALRVRRAHVEQALRRAGIAPAHRVASAMYRSLGQGLFELVAMALRPGRALDVDLDRERFDGLSAGGRGFVVATAHTGNWDLVGCAAAEQVPLTVVTKKLSIGFLDRLWQGARRARGATLVSPGQARRAARAALGRGEAVVMVIDQAPERERGTLVLPFLGQLARVDLAPALIALSARAPLVIAFPLRRDDGRHALQIARVIEPPEHPSRQWAERAMALATGDLEQFVRRHPEQWLWMHRRWKDAPGAGEGEIADALSVDGARFADAPAIVAGEAELPGARSLGKEAA